MTPSFWPIGPRRWLFLGCLMLTACAGSPIEQSRLPDGTLRFTCQLAMDECVRRVQNQCPNQRFRILHGKSETRLRDAPPFERAYHTSHLHLKCSSDGAIEPLGSKEPEAGPNPPAPAMARACGIGETRGCVGPGGCPGGQVCLPDRSGYGPCDCGSAAPSNSPTPATVPSVEMTQPAAPNAPASSPTP